MKTTPDDKVWTVYEHITPIGKKYFGITNASDLNLRWANGLGYRTQQVFFRAIVKYGWDNIIHNVIAKDLSLNEAKRMEEKLIEKERTNITKYGH